MPRFWLGALIVYAAIGLVVSLVVHVASLFVSPPGGNGLFFGLHIGIFPLWIAVMFLANKLVGRGFGQRPAWADWKLILDGSPAWMRVMTYGFFAYAIANFAVFFLLTISGHDGARHTANPPAVVWHGFSGHWMAFYSAGLAIATVAFLRGPESLAPKCPNGHAVSSTDRFCPQCGQAIADRNSRRR
jgi:hypothetical protein